MTVCTVKSRVVLLAGAGVVLILASLYYLFFSDRIDTVVTGRIYRSAQLSADGLQKIIREKGIRSIVNLRGNYTESAWYIMEREISEKNNVRLYDVMLSAHDLPEYGKLMSLLDILSKSERPILIHCRRGSDRTGLVSALALLFEEDSPLSRAKEQFSWRYGVFPFYRSVGPLFFFQYEQWLKSAHNTHTRDNLIYWMRNEYLDGQGNIEYWVEGINGTTVKGKKSRVTIHGAPKNIVIEGWAFDSHTKTPADGLMLVVDNRIPLRVDFRYDRPDIARYFSLGEQYYGHFPVGWRAEFNADLVGKGCHALSLRLARKGRESFAIPEGYEVCF